MARLLFAWALLIAILLAYITVVPQFRPREQRTIANSGMTLAMASLGQTLVVLTGGIDLSIGPMVSLTNSIASALTDKEIPRGSMVMAAAGAPWPWARSVGSSTGSMVAYGRLAADHRHPGDRLDLDRDRALHPALTRRLHPA